MFPVLMDFIIAPGDFVVVSESVVYYDGPEFGCEAVPVWRSRNRFPQ
jgi:hypothetical protein